MYVCMYIVHTCILAYILCIYVLRILCMYLDCLKVMEKKQSSVVKPSLTQGEQDSVVVVPPNINTNTIPTKTGT